MIQIPCETIVRLAPIIDREAEPVFQTMRLDNGRIIITDRKFGVVERLDHPFTGVFHLHLTDALIEQCRTESAFSSVLTITPNPILQWTSATTTLGWAPPDNLGYYGDRGQYEQWYDKMVRPCITPATEPNGALVCHASDVARLAATSPSGSVVFERVINTARPTLLRDINSPDWVGFFHPRFNDGIYHPPAAVPDWLAREGE